MNKNSKDRNKLLDSFLEQGVIKQVANIKFAQDAFSSNNKIWFYLGIDPTSDSLHIGHYSLFVFIKKIYINTNFRPLFLIGDFTASIGDPSGKKDERQVLSKKIIKHNSKKLIEQIKWVMERLEINEFDILQNSNFYEDMNLINFFQVFGKKFNMNNMLNKEFVKNRLVTGISYTEFSYQIFQSIDFYKLYKEKNVKFQISGSDQWGNITSGLDFIRKSEGDKANIFAITIPLIEDKFGNKLGKTSNNTIWLDKTKTSVYKLFQYFYNLSDDFSKKLINLITNLSETKIIDISKDVDSMKSKRLFQMRIAHNIISTLYSNSEYDRVSKISSVIFNQDYKSLKLEDIEVLEKDMIIIELNEREVKKTISDIIYDKKLLNSRREVREFLNSNAVKLNNDVVNKFDSPSFISDYSNFLFENKFIFLSIGKKNKFIVKLI